MAPSIHSKNQGYAKSSLPKKTPTFIKNPAFLLPFFQTSQVTNSTPYLKIFSHQNQHNHKPRHTLEPSGCHEAHLLTVRRCLCSGLCRLSAFSSLSVSSESSNCDFHCEARVRPPPPPLVAGWDTLSSSARANWVMDTSR